ncbi:YncE family protein [Streptomyces sp. x-80]|uniref:YncE family protein n=1 Tax=Streptomyces sp. x-80 TaxID=2789282 RepID=UPI00398040E2
MSEGASYHFYLACQGRNEDQSDSAIVVIDPAEGKVRASTSQGFISPRSLAGQPGVDRLYVVDAHDPTAVSIIDCVQLQPHDDDVAPEDGNLGHAALSPDGERLLVTANSGRTLYEVDTKTNLSVRHYDLPGTEGGLTLSGDGERVYMGTSGNFWSPAGITPRVAMLELADRDDPPVTASDDEEEEPMDKPRQVLGPVDIGTTVEKITGVRVLLSADDSRLYAWEPKSTDALVVLDTQTFQITAQAKGRPPGAIALSPDGERLYAVYHDRGGVILDPTTLTSTDTFPADPDASPILCMGPDGTLLVAYSTGTAVLITPDGEAGTPFSVSGIPQNAVTAAPTQA